MSADIQFSEFVKRQQRQVAVDNAIDWNKQRDEWLDYLQQLYNNIKEYLASYIDGGEITLRESTTEINEENIGVYSAKKLTILIGVQEITLTPIGTLMIGSKGRVDVEGSAGKSRLVLIDKDVTDARSMFSVSVRVINPDDPPEPSEPRPPKRIEWAWKIVSSPPSLKFVELYKDSFFVMLM